MCALAYMDGTGDAGDPACAYTFDVIGIDFKAYALLCSHVDTTGSGYASERFGKGGGGTSVKQSHGLVGAVIDWHAGFDVIIADGGEGDAQVCHHGVGRHCVEGLERNGRIKQRHLVSIGLVAAGNRYTINYFPIFAPAKTGFSCFERPQNNSKLNTKKIYIVRHGQTDFNMRGIVQGSGVDSSLNETGREQARAFFEAYRHVQFDKVYTSVLRRSIESVQGFIDGGIPHERLAGLNEISWGKKEGQPITPEEDAYYHHMLRAWRAGHTSEKIEGGESPDEVVVRMKPAVDHILRQENERTVLVCMHGRAIRILLCHLLRYPLMSMDMFEHQNACLYVVHFTGTLFSVAVHHDVTHLQAHRLHAVPA